MTERMRMNQAISRALADEMRLDANVIVLGEDVAEAGGVFKTTEGLLSEFGATRVRDTPISEMGFMGAGVGAAVCGLRPVVEIMFVEFLGVALDQLVTTAAKFRYLSGGALQVPLVVRASVGSGAGFGCQHSQTLETWFAATPGLKVVMPSGARSAYALTRAAIQDDNPVVILEPRVLYGTRESFDPASVSIELGRAQVVRPGDDITVVALGLTVGTAMKAAEQSASSAEVLDLTTLQPWDEDSVLASVRRTGRLLVVEESPRSGGWGADVVAAVAQQCYSDLKAPPVRITAPDVPVPFSVRLEREYAPSTDHVAASIDELVKNGAPVPAWWEGVA